LARLCSFVMMVFILVPLLGRDRPIWCAGWDLGWILLLVFKRPGAGWLDVLPTRNFDEEDVLSAAQSKRTLARVCAYFVGPDVDGRYQVFVGLYFWGLRLPF